YAAQISHNAAEAARQVGVPFLALRRPPWRRVEGDRWKEAGGVAEAVVTLGAQSRRVFLALGKQEVHVLSTAPRHSYLIRSVDPVEPPLDVSDARYNTARGPFDEVAEHALLEENRIGVVGAKNRGGPSHMGQI